MKKLQFLCVLPMLLALIFIVTGCDNGSSSSSDNATMYVAYPDNSTQLAIIIADPAGLTKAAYSPKTGHWYQIEVISITSYKDDLASMGEVTISGNTITFKPFASMGFTHGSFTGTVSGNYITLASVPKTSFTNVRFEKAGTFFIDGNDWDNSSGSNSGDDDDDDGTGTGGGGGGSGGSSGGGGSGGGNVTSGAAFSPGRCVTDVFISKAPTVSTAYAGTKVDLSGIVVTIAYSDGSTKTTSNAADFIVDPPYYTVGGADHTITYIAEYYNHPTASPAKDRIQFKAPVYAPAGNPKTYFYVLHPSPDITITGKDSVVYYPGYGFETSGMVITARHDVGVLTPSAPRALHFTVGTPTSAAPPSISAVLTYGASGTDSITIPPAKHYTLTGINVSRAPAFKDQIIFDDPRFSGANAMSHWFSHMTDGYIGLIYNNTTSITKSIRMAEAASRGLLTFTLSGYDLTFSYSGLTTDPFTVPVYDTLVGLTINGGTIVMDRNQGHDLQYFLRQVTVSAVYQLGNNKNNTVKRANIFRVNPSPNPVIIDREYINGDFTENLSGTTDSSILTTSNSNKYIRDGLKSKVTIFFNTRSWSNTDAQTKTASIDIGVINY